MSTKWDGARGASYDEAMDVVVNGEMRAIGEGSTVAELLEILELKGLACAVEVNRELVRKEEHRSRALTAGDEIEVVTLVGGG